MHNQKPGCINKRSIFWKKLFCFTNFVTWNQKHLGLFLCQDLNLILHLFSTAHYKYISNDKLIYLANIRNLKLTN